MFFFYLLDINRIIRDDIMKKIKVMSVFSGVGGLEQGLDERFEVVGHSEINKSACSILRYHYKDIPNFGDISKIDSKQLPKFDMLVGGSPCQNLSMAGNKKGLAGTKSSLFFIFAKLLKENKPKYFIWENVKGTYYSNNGLDFLAVQEAFSECGYHFQWQLLNAEDFGVGQVRNRVFVVGALDPKDLPGLINIVKKTKNKNEDLKFSHFCGSLIKDGFTQTITASYGALSGNGTKILDSKIELSEKSLKKISEEKTNTKIRLITPNEGEKLMSWGSQWTKYGLSEKGELIEISDRERYRAIGNGIVSNCVAAISKLFLHNTSKKFEEANAFDTLPSLSFESPELFEKYCLFLKQQNGLVSNTDYIVYKKSIIIKSSSMISFLLKNPIFLNQKYKIKHQYKGLLINGKYMVDPNQTDHIALNIPFSEIKDQSVDKKYFLSSKDCAYLLKRLKKTST